MDKKTRTAVLLCSYNGSQYIRQQIDSIINQTETEWTVFVSDDGSTDGTLDILKYYQEKLGRERFVIIDGPGKGFAWNFISLLEKCGDAFDYYAFSDQDDEWMPDKLSRSISVLSGYKHNVPSVYCGRTSLVDENGHHLGESPLFSKPPSFKNALIQSIAGGNTMILNRAGRNIINKTPIDVRIISHDWWIYIVITAIGGNIFYDPKPSINYRQHTNNIVGSNLGWLARFKRISGLMDGHFKMWIDSNIYALNKADVNITPENRFILESFNEARNSNLFKRLYLFRKLGMYRQTLLGTLGLYVAIVLKKL
ncbi:glycosyltransferase family 2 protein [Pantoea sp. B550]|uniref:glycosyltransferase family 2 protein n=1 Tax=Pantoea TaxID=53335 RepID=UPI001CA45FF3|nr:MULTISPECIES: glycosyltransferase family 2 protein [Pantoea]MCP1205027.1 glycosyltransferase family 2 protein [Pantoea sp. B550]QZX98203.1 glycosyltransferase family 2 protein [Pantoea alfalfae]